MSNRMYGLIVIVLLLGAVALGFYIYDILNPVGYKAYDYKEGWSPTEIYRPYR